MKITFICKGKDLIKTLNKVSKELSKKELADPQNQTSSNK